MRILIFACFCFVTPLCAQLPCYDFKLLQPFVTDDRPPYRTVFSMEYAQDGNILVSGSLWDGGTTTDPTFWVAKMTPLGEILWENMDPLAPGYFSRAYKVVEGPDGNIIAGGSTLLDPIATNDTTQIILRKFTPQGQMIWQRSFGELNQREDFFDLIICNDGGYAILGEEVHIGLLEDYVWVIKTDQNGQLEWIQRHGDSPVENPESIITFPNGNFLVAGNTWSKFEPQDQFGHGGMLLMLDPLGAAIWKKKEPNNKDAVFYDLILDNDGSFWALGNIGLFSASDSEVWLVHFSASGEIIQQFSYGGTNYDYAIKLLKNPSGGFYILAGSLSDNGDLCGNFGNYDAWLIQTDATGKMIWQTNLGGKKFDYFGDALPIDNGIIAAGSFSPSLFPDTILHGLVTIKNFQNIESMQIDSTVCAGETIAYWPTQPCGQVTWNNPEYNLMLNITEPGMYQGTLQNGSCKADFQFNAHFEPCSDEPCVLLPNAFTPNQDGANDIFSPIIQCGDVDEYVFQVFNRWGERIYTSNRPDDAGWDGRSKEIDCPSDTYVWTLSYHIRTKLYENRTLERGSVTLLR